MVLFSNYARHGSANKPGKMALLSESWQAVEPVQLYYVPFLLIGVGVCRDKVDLAFLVDASGDKDKRGREHFKTSLAIAKAIASMFVVNHLQTHIGFVVFSTNSQVVLNFKTYFDQKSVENAIDGIQYLGGNTNIGAGLRLVKKELFDATSRTNVPHILIVLTSGKSTEDVITPSKALRDSGVTVFCIGIGKMYNEKELDEIATDPDASHVLTADVARLGLVIKAVKVNICKGKKENYAWLSEKKNSFCKDGTSYLNVSFPIFSQDLTKIAERS